MIIFRCAVCDDEKYAADSIHSIINEYPVELGCEVFSDPLDLFAAVQKGKRFDLFILDIVMPAHNKQFVLDITNSYEGTVVFDESERPVSQRKDHGMGSQSIFAFIRKYNSTIDYSAKNSVFNVRIMFTDYSEQSSPQAVCS